MSVDEVLDTILRIDAVMALSAFSIALVVFLIWLGVELFRSEF